MIGVSETEVWWWEITGSSIYVRIQCLGVKAWWGW